MAGFVGLLESVRVHGSDKLKVLTKPLRYRSDLLRVVITVPKGFLFDGASVPRVMPIAFAILGGKAEEPSCVHDWTYHAGTYPRETADAVFREACLSIGLPEWQAEAFYHGVRAGGWRTWADHARWRVEGAPQDGCPNCWSVKPAVAP